MKDLETLQALIIDWADEKGINNADKQYLKILEETGETARAILKKDKPEIIDGLGDIAVTVMIYYDIVNRELNTDEQQMEDPYFETEATIFQEMLQAIEQLDHLPLFYLHDIAYKHKTTLVHCLNVAWNEIKDRQGKTVNGTFIKD